MYFPWYGLFEQVRLSEVFVHYDDVQLPQGRSFVSRVQIKTAQGSQWLTIPLRRGGMQLIKDVQTDSSQRWRDKHLALLSQSYAKAPFRDEMLALAEPILRLPTDNLCDLAVAGIESIAKYFSLAPRFCRASSLSIPGRSTERLLDITKHFKGDVYVTGHGARNYLEHEKFEQAGISVEYMSYQRAEYAQLNGLFDPHVTVLDLVANEGRAGISWIRSGTEHWKDFLK